MKKKKRLKPRIGIHIKQESNITLMQRRLILFQILFLWGLINIIRTYVKLYTHAGSAKYDYVQSYEWQMKCNVNNI